MTVYANVFANRLRPFKHVLPTKIVSDKDGLEESGLMLRRRGTTAQLVTKKYEC